MQIIGAARQHENVENVTKIVKDFLFSWLWAKTLNTYKVNMS